MAKLNLTDEQVEREIDRLQNRDVMANGIYSYRT